MFLVDVTRLLGTLCGFYLTLKCVKLVLQVLKTCLLGGTVDLKAFGKWAVVTGCTDGIGKEYAKQLASKGINVVLMGRNAKKLDDVASEIEIESKAKTKIIQVDFSGGHEIYEPLVNELEGLEIGILVNNVGVSCDFPQYLHELPVELFWTEVNVNVMAATMLTRLLISAMVERNKGLVINVSSYAGSIPTPILGPYGATKAFTDKFSKNLRLEYADKGIVIQNVAPLYVATKMTGIKNPSLFSPSPDVYVRSVLKNVGVRDSCYGYWPHELQAFVISLLPEWLIRKLVMFELSKKTRASEKSKDKKAS